MRINQRCSHIGTDLALLIPPTDAGPFTATIEDQQPLDVHAIDNSVRMRLPAAPKRLWHVRLDRQ